MSLGILSFQRKNKNSIIAFQTAASALWATQFLLLGGYAGATQNALGIARNSILRQRGKHKWADSHITTASILIAIAACGVFTLKIEGAWALLTIIATYIQTFAYFLKRENIIRLICIPVSILWLIYDLHAGTIAGVICELFNLASILIALWRFRTKKTSDVQSPDLSARE